MARKFTEYQCSDCKKITSKQLGVCPQCKGIGTISELVTSNTNGNMVGTKSKGEVEASDPALNIKDVQADAHKHNPTGIGELDRVLGGGLVAGGVILLAGPPGVGKALEVNTPIPTHTNNGIEWKAIKDLAVTDMVYSENGQPINIKAISETWLQRPSYKLSFTPTLLHTDKAGENYYEIEETHTQQSFTPDPNSETFDDSSIIADENHEWFTQTEDETTPSVKTTREIAETLHKKHVLIEANPPTQHATVTVTEDELKSSVNRIKGFINSHPEIEYYGDSPIHAELHNFTTESKRTFLNQLIPNFAHNIAESAYTEFTVSGSQRAKSLIKFITEAGYFVEAETYYKVIKVSVYEARTRISMAEPTPADTVCIEVDSDTHLFLAGKRMFPTHNSSILATVAGILSREEPVLYVSGEESVQQIKIRHERMGALGNHLFVINEPNLSKVLWQIDEVKPKLLIVDSLQTIASPNIDSSTGSVSQLTEVAKVITNIAKQRGIPTIFVGHYTKDGNVAGPRTVEHLVDVVLSFEGEDDSPLRLLRGIKNRFGQADEIGCFEHTENGLEEVADPSGFFMDERTESPQGVATSIYLEGKRALPIEIQSLVVPSPLPNPRKVTTGLDSGRTMQLFAILQKHGSQRLADKDIYVSTLGNIKVKEPGVDLATAFSIVSDARNTPVRHDAVFIGEIALSGKIRKVQGIYKRLAEAVKLGFPFAYVPEGTKANLPKSLVGKIVLIELKDVSKIPPILDAMKASIDVGDFN